MQETPIADTALPDSAHTHPGCVREGHREVNVRQLIRTEPTPADTDVPYFVYDISQPATEQLN